LILSGCAPIISAMSEARPVYLDHHATTPCDPRVVEAMLPYLAEEFGNAASRTHAFGWRAERALESAREQVAGAIGADPREIVFTSGATESDNLAILGAVRAAGVRGAHVVSCRTEHNAVLDPCRALEKEGARVTLVGVNRDGHVDPAELAEALEPETVLISLMHANNEVGVVHDLAPLARLARERGILFHSDAAQSLGRIPVDVGALGVDLLSLTAHKVYGPKGIGALYVRREPRVRLEPLVYGGGHERGMRSGTVPVALAVALGRALEIAMQERDAEAARQRELRDHMWRRLGAEIEDVTLNGDAERRLPGNLNVSFGGVEGEALILALDGIALSTGSACTSARPEPSHVLRALGVPKARALGSLRIGIGRGNTRAEIDLAADAIVAQAERLRALSPAWDGGGRGRRRS